MEQNSPCESTSGAKDILEGQVRECFGRVVYSHKTHEKCTDILLRRLSFIKVTQIVLSALTTAGFVGVFFGDGRLSALLGLFISTVLLMLNSYTKNYDIGEIAQKHKQAANDLWLIREKYLSLLADLAISTSPIETIQKHRDELLEQLHAVYCGAPSTNFKAYKYAQKALKNMEDMTFRDDEIDAFLPGELKRKKQLS